jgi:AcrR family transcriptional regulator
MKTSFRQSREANGSINPTVAPLPARERVLEVACELFAEAGFHGTHLRETCKRAGTNVAGVCYHFQSKEGLYKAVVMEAGRWLSNHDGNFAVSRKLSPEQRLLRLTESLLERLNAKGAWTAKLLARELVDPACGAHTYVASGLERDFVLLLSGMRELHGAGVHSETIRLQTLSLISECVLYSLAGENQEHPLIQLAAPLPSRARLAQLLTQRSVGSLDLDGAKPEVSQP